MPYESHPILPTPPDDTVLWRYLNFPKLLDILERRALWFARLDKLEDPLEGNWTDSEVEHLRSLPSVPSASGTAMAEGALRSAYEMRLSTFVSCWREGPNESMAMWDIYRRGGCVIAVKSTIGRLKEAMAHFEKPVHIAEVKYVDWKDAPWDNNLLAMCVRKELAYRHEAEVRAVIWDVELLVRGRLLIGSKYAPKWMGVLARLREEVPCHKEVAFDPTQLITEVVLGPREKEWIYTLLKRIMERYGLPQPVIASKLLDSRS